MPAPAPKPELVLSGPPSAKSQALMLLCFVILYAIACALPAMRLEGRQQVWYGVELMVIGPFGIPHGQYAWLANIDAVAALFCAMKGRTTAAIILTGVAFGLALQSLWMPGTTIPLSNAPEDTVRVVSLSFGFYAWVIALLMPLAAAFLHHHARAKPQADFAG